MVNLYNSNVDINSNQSIYDSFNNFIFSKDRNVFNKLASRIWFYQQTKHLLGDIVECGVFKGSGLLTWLKVLDMYEPNSIKKVIGFDFFNPNFIEDMPDGVDKETMRQVFQRDENLMMNDVSFEGITYKIVNANFGDSKFELVAGDITKSSYEYLKERPGFRISILYLDLDLDEPTYETLNALWDRVLPGGYVVFDEYGYHNWSESNAADRFLKEKNLTLHTTGIKAPTAYIVK